MHPRRRALFLGIPLAISSVAGCTNPRLEPCDIGTKECQADVYYALARLRGDGIDPFVGVPPIRTLTRDDFRKQLEAQAEQSRQQRQQQGEPEVNPTDVALQLLGMITKTQAPAQTSVDNQVNAIAAFYSARDQMVTVIERPADSDRTADTQLLLHELVHAFQDKDVGFGGTQSSSDESFARSALIEGEAVHYELLALREMKNEDPDAFDWDQLYGGWRDGSRAAASQSSSPFFASQWFVYPLGGHMTTARWFAGGNGAVRSLQAHWPRSSLAYMLGPRTNAPTSLGLSCPVPDPPREMELRALNQLGAIQFYALLLGQGVEHGIAWDLSLAWRGDAFMVFFEPTTEAVLGSWRIALDSETTATAVAAQLPETETLEIVRQQAHVVVNVASDGALLSGWQGIAECG